MKKLLTLFALFSLTLFTFSCDEKRGVSEDVPTALEFLEAKGNYTILIKALTKTNLVNTFKNPGSITLFAPNDDAFSAASISAASIDAMTIVQIADLSKTLQYHVINIGTQSFDLPNGAYTNTIATYGTSTSTLSLFVNRSSGVLLNGGAANGGATVINGDNYVSNGVIHEISNVMALPKVTNLIAANPNLSTLLGVVTSTPQAAILTDLSTTATGATTALSRTVFAPTNAAFTSATFLTGQSDANITKVLQYHITNNNTRASSSTVFAATNTVINTQLTPPQQTITVTANTVRIVDTTTANATIATVNVQGVNGVVHIISKVLQPTL
jgi:uncharacterized surface protein with fasciclin (FAS1) repeats